MKQGKDIQGMYADIEYVNRRTGKTFVKRCKIIRFMGSKRKTYYRVHCPNKGHSNVKFSQLNNISTNQ